MSKTHYSFSSQQWIGLHQEVANLDILSSLIKLFAVMVMFTKVTPNPLAVIAFIVVIEVMVKTYQSRSMDMLVKLEMIEADVLKVYSDYSESTLSGLGKLKEYVRNLNKPTVGIFYYVLILTHYLLTSI